MKRPRRAKESPADGRGPAVLAARLLIAAPWLVAGGDTGVAADAPAVPVAGRATAATRPTAPPTPMPNARRPADILATPGITLNPRPAAQPAADGQVNRTAAPDEDEVAPVPVLPRMAPAVPPQPEYPLDLNVALRLAQGENPEIARVRTEITVALAEQSQARALLLPTLNAGTNYHAHNGNLQRSSGRILSLSEQSLYFGGGARTLAAESLAIPAVNIVSPITEAWFEPLAARQRVNRAQAVTAATFNQVLGEVAVLYIELLGAQALLETVRLNAGQTEQVVEIVSSFARQGARREADADRARVNLRLREAEIQRAEGEVAAAAARLAQRLNLDPSIRLVAQSGPLMPISLIDPASDPIQLTTVALRRRPELAARSAEIAESQVRVKEEIYRPLLPYLWIGFSGGAFGGGSNLSQPYLGRFSGRTDFDVRLFWTVMNFGAGNASRIRQRRAQVGQAIAERSVTINRVRREVAEALAISAARSRQIDEARRQMEVAERGFNEDLQRAREALGKPIEVLDNLELLSEARIRLVRAIVQYDQAQFRLFVALGSPPPLPNPTITPTAPPPITTPLHAPIVSQPAPGEGMRLLGDMHGRP